MSKYHNDGILNLYNLNIFIINSIQFESYAVLFLAHVIAALLFCFLETSSDNEKAFATQVWPSK